MRVKLAVLTVIVALMAGSVAALHALDKQPVKAITPADVAKALELKEREEALVAKEAEFAKKAEEQAQMRKDVEEKLVRLSAMQSELKGQFEAIKGAQRQEFMNLIKIYSAMSPSKVAPLLDSMDDGDVVRILRAMKAEQVAKIMPKLTQPKAVSVSQEMGMLAEQR